MRKLFFAFVLLLCVLPIFAQNGTPHGVNVSWVAPSPIGGSGTIQGYYLFRCTGTGTCATWTSVGGLLTATSFLDPAAGLTVNTTYQYAVLTVDSNGNESVFSNIATVAVGSSFPPNPGPPSSCTAKVQ